MKTKETLISYITDCEIVNADEVIKAINENDFTNEAFKTFELGEYIAAADNGCFDIVKMILELRGVIA